MPFSTAAEVQRRLDDLLDHMPAGVVVHGADGRIINANALACELIGRTIEQLRGAEPFDSTWHLVAADGSEMSADELPVNIVLRTREQQSGILLGIVTHKPDVVRWMICNAYPEFDADRQLCRVVVCFTDCTGLKQAEQQLHKSEERLRLVLEGSTDAPWDDDLVTGDIYYSARWWTMIGYEPGALPVTPGLWLDLAHPDDRQRVTSFLEEVIGGRHASYSFEFRLRHKDGHYLPVLSRGFVLRDARGKALRLSGTNTDLTERKLAEQRIHELAYFDHLTGLPNRRLLIQELGNALSRSQRSGHHGAVIFLDLDNFKLLNDTMGHDQGDLLLRQVADRLRRAVRHCDQLARLGGDEFVLVLEELGLDLAEAANEAQHVLEKLLAVLGQPYYLAGRLFVSTPSMGITLFQGMKTGIEGLLKQADLAMYRAKSDGRNTARFFDAHMQASAERQAALEGALREGLSAQQFVLFCQPQFSAEGQLVGAEILLRWRRHGGELLCPNEFIGLAETSGMIVPLGRYVLEETCRTLARWRADSTLAKVELAVNISAHQLRGSDLPSSVAEILQHTGAPPTKLCLELTESVFAGNSTDVVEHMHALRNLGVHFSLDDFGTGYSSLAYLKRFPLTALKIDRSFVHDVHLDHEGSPFVEAIIALAQKLKLDIVAEGVEVEAQRTFLVNSGCQTLQGYLLGAPMPLHEFEKTFASGR